MRGHFQAHNALGNMMDVPTELLSPKNMTNRNLQSCRSKSNSYLQRPDNRETYWICTARPNKPRRCGKSEPGAASNTGPTWHRHCPPAWVRLQPCKYHATLSKLTLTFDCAAWLQNACPPISIQSKPVKLQAEPAAILGSFTDLPLSARRPTIGEGSGSGLGSL